MASSSGMFLFWSDRSAGAPPAVRRASFSPIGPAGHGCYKCGADAVGRRRHATDAYANRIVNCVENCRSGWDYRLLADPFGTEWANGRRIFDENRLDQRHVARGRNQIIVKVLAFAGKELLHQRHPQALGGAAFDLSFNECWIDGPADVVRGSDLQHAHGAQFGVYRNLGQVSAEPINRIGLALAVVVQDAGGRIESRLSSEYVTVLVQGQLAQADGSLLAVFFNCDRTI